MSEFGDGQPPPVLNTVETGFSYYVSPLCFSVPSVWVTNLHGAPFLQNPDDPSTYPPPMDDGQHPPTHANPLSPVHRTHGQGM